MTQQYDVDLCIIGAGSAGLSMAAGAAQLGRSVVLFEGEKMGGDCLNYGCVPPDWREPNRDQLLFG